MDVRNVVFFAACPDCFVFCMQQIHRVDKDTGEVHCRCTACEYNYLLEDLDDDENN